jgi:hypothetical protein
MHEDATAILRCYTEEAVSKSKKENRKKVYPDRPNKDVVKREEQNADGINNADEEVAGCTDGHDEKRPRVSLAEASDDDLLMELARRKADKFRLSGSMQKFVAGDDVDDGPDPTGQVCSLNGGPGSIPCRELME